MPGLSSALVLWASVAGAETQLLAGKRLVLRQSSKSERLVVVSHDRLVAPLPGGSDDPTFRGAVLEIGNPSTGEWARFMLPAAGWTLNALGTVFRYQGGHMRAPGAVSELVIRHGKRLKVRATAVGLSLDEAAQGGLAVVLTIGSRRYCMLFAGTAVKRDRPRRFAARNAPAPVDCPVAPVAASTTSTSLRPALPSTTSTTRTTQPIPGSTSTSSSTSSTRRSTTVTVRPTSTTSSTHAPTITTTTSLRPSTTTSTSLRPTTTTSTSLPPSTSTSTSTSSSSTSSATSTSSTSPTSSTTTSTDYTCGGFALFCGGTCKPPARCVGGLITRCHCEVVIP